MHVLDAVAPFVGVVAPIVIGCASPELTSFCLVVNADVGERDCGIVFLGSESEGNLGVLQVDASQVILRESGLLASLKGNDVIEQAKSVILVFLQCNAHLAYVFICFERDGEGIVVVAVNGNRCFELQPAIIRKPTSGWHCDGVCVALLSFVELFPVVNAASVIAAFAVEEQLSSPRGNVTHIEHVFWLRVVATTILLFCVETYIGKGSAPVLMNVHGHDILFAIQFDERFLFLG